jgi:tRNA(Ile)-lysidine synthetase-like protein
MKLEVPQGSYIIAVSGGVDSMSLLHIVTKRPSIELVVAHFNHRMRDDSDEDEKLVKSAAKAYGLPIEIGRAESTLDNEADARTARYRFLREIRAKYQADKIMTAHHQDDKLETALLNIIRGTGLKGLSAIADNPEVIRPLLYTPKAEIVDYAKRHHLKWREDASNSDMSFLRNRIRLQIIPKLTPEEKEIIVRNVDKVAKINTTIMRQIATISQDIYTKDGLNRQLFSNLPSEVGKVLLTIWLRQNGAGDFDRQTIERLSLAIKTAKPGSQQPIKSRNYLKISQDSVLFSHTLQ